MTAFLKPFTYSESITMPVLEPYKHDCDRCVWVSWIRVENQWGNMYFCPPQPDAIVKMGSVVIRLSDEPSDYWSSPISLAGKGSLDLGHRARIEGPHPISLMVSNLSKAMSDVRAFIASGKLDDSPHANEQREALAKLLSEGVFDGEKEEDQEESQGPEEGEGGTQET